jgi:RNA polymerase sigma-70 factor (ECF subfamily)
MTNTTESARFEEAIEPHLDAAYNLARWLVRSKDEAEDLVQESCLRAWKGFSGFRGGNMRSWLLAIVRNTCYSWLRSNRRQDLAVEFDEGAHTPDATAPDAEGLLVAEASREALARVLEELPAEFREALVLRELEGLSYKEIGDVAGVPVGTVMSRLARARARLTAILSPAGAAGAAGNKAASAASGIGTGGVAGRSTKEAADELRGS